MASLLNTIKQASMAANSASNPVNVLFGVVTKSNPLEVNVDQRFTLPADFLIVPESLMPIELPAALQQQESKLLIRRGLEAGDKVLLLRLQGGQQFVVLDRVVKL